MVPLGERQGTRLSGARHFFAPALVGIQRFRARTGGHGGGRWGGHFGAQVRRAGHAINDHARVPLQLSVDCFLDLRRRDLPQGGNLPDEVGGITRVVVVLIQGFSEATHLLQAGDQPGFDGVAGAFQFTAIHRRLAQLVQFLVDSRFDLLGRMPRPRCDIDFENRTQLQGFRARRNVLGDLHFIHKRAIQPARFAAAQYLPREGELRVARCKNPGCMPAHDDPLQFDPVLNDGALFFSYHRLGNGDRLHFGTMLEAAKILFHQLLGACLVNVADDAQRGVVGPVIDLEKFLDVFQRGRLYVRVGADDDGMVGMLPGKQVVPQGFLDDAVRLVLARLAAFVAHHVLLVRQRRLVEHVEQIAHAVGMGPQGEFQLMGWDSVVVVSAVERSGGIRFRAACSLQQQFCRTARNMLGTGKHHVLEEMRKAGAARFLVRGADVIPDVDRCQRQTLVFHKNDFEAIGKPVFLVVYFWQIVRDRGRRGPRDKGNR